jgi:hypothetical protein
MKIEKPDFGSLKPLRLSEFADSVEYLQLETTDECLLSYYESGQRVGDLLFIGQILVFDIVTGKFLNRIGRTGEGPEEYSRPRFAVDEANRKVLVNSSDRQGTMIFDFDGTYLGHLKDSLLVACFGSITGLSAGNGHFIYMNMLIDASHQWACAPYELMVYDYINHRVLPGLTNQLVCRHPTAGRVHLNPTQILTKQGDLHYYKAVYNDTLYAVGDKGIYPYAVIDAGKLKYSVELLFPAVWPPHQESFGDGKLFISDVYVHQDYILLECILGIRNGSGFVCKYDMATGDLTYHAPYIINDIDGGDDALIFVGGIRSGVAAVAPSEFAEKKVSLSKSELKYLSFPPFSPQ